MEQRLLAWLAERKLMPSPELVAHLAQRPDGLALLERSVAALDAPRLFLGLDDMLPEPAKASDVPATTPPDADPAGETPAPSAGVDKTAEMTGAKRTAAAREAAPPPHIIAQIDETKADGSLDNYVKLFNHRYQTLSRMVRRNPIMREAGSLRGFETDGEVKVLGMVAEARPIRNGRLRVVLEDPEARQPVLFTEPEGGSYNILPDEVIGIAGRLSPRGDMLYANGPPVRPSLGRLREPRRATDPHKALFISDLHIGSNTFQKREWQRFIAWLNGEVDFHPGWVPRPGYLVMVGDVVDGIDAYPDQEKDLEITDIWEQYAALAEYVAQMPTDLQIVILPGNHDAVRLMEPQLPLPERVREFFPSNVTFTANPVLLDLAGVRVLAYHGKSMDDLVSLRELGYDRPHLAMKEMLNRRHLAPQYGSKTPLAPEPHDHLIIHEVPELFVTGHVHACRVDQHQGILLVNPGTWQAQTDYQRMMNFQPDPARAVAVDLQSFDTRVLDFNL